MQKNRQHPGSTTLQVRHDRLLALLAPTKRRFMLGRTLQRQQQSPDPRMSLPSSAPRGCACVVRAHEQRSHQPAHDQAPAPSPSPFGPSHSTTPGHPRAIAHHTRILPTQLQHPRTHQDIPSSRRISASATHPAHFRREQIQDPPTSKLPDALHFPTWMSPHWSHQRRESRNPAF